MRDLLLAARFRLARRPAAIALALACCGVLALGLTRGGNRAPTFVPSTRQRGPAVSSRGGLGQRPQRAGYELAMALGPAVVGQSIPPAARAAARARTAGSTLAAAGATAVPPRTEVLLYQVRPGDNLWLIAQRFGLDQGTVVWANPKLAEDPDRLKIGQELYILPVDGVWHTVKAGDTLAAIAKRYQVDAAQILAYAPNGIADPASLTVGQKLIIPGGKMPVAPKPAAAPASGAAVSSGNRIMIPAGAPATPVDAPAQPGRFNWPAQGLITQGYGPWHGAIDIANHQGTPLLACDAGTVVVAGWSGGLGNAVQIDHGDGFVTTYGHLYKIEVQVGQQVAKGEEFGLMGTTGHSTGPHVHLIFTYKGGIVNPLNYLP